MENKFVHKEIARLTMNNLIINQHKGSFYLHDSEAAKNITLEGQKAMEKLTNIMYYSKK